MNSSFRCFQYLGAAQNVAILINQLRMNYHRKFAM
jgi:hypothetical protein